ncbi:hypothetical protein N2W45_003037 [Clostridium perfringens]|uniref:hypothetical protein n=2 Tax=Clostridium TaxID=1485 RepID=UPI0018AB0C54|nr:hypothetical protein [Clostridium perfringens]EJT6499998.1 hypothetical protein [Clostridium perfringens]
MENLNFENDFNWDMISDSEQNCFDYEPEYNIDDDPFAVDEETYSEKVDRLNKDYIYEDYNAIWKNLKKRHFYLDDKDKQKKYGNVAAEVRAINRKFGGVKSYPIFDFSNDSKVKFLNWFKANIKGKGYCIYSAVHTFYPKKTAIKPDGTEYDMKTNHINIGPTYHLTLDFDHISEEENRFADVILTGLNIPYDSLRTSEEGWQKIFYLDNICWDSEAIKKFTALALSRGLKVDPEFSNIAQIERVLGGINNKCFLKKSIDRKTQFRVVLEKSTDEKISLEKLWRAVSSLPIVDNSIDVIPIYPEKPKSKKEIKEEIVNKFNIAYGDILNEHWLKYTDPTVKTMLMSCKMGIRNSVMLTIVPYLKHYMKLEREEFILLINRWSNITNGGIEVNEYIYNWDTYSHLDKNGKPYIQGKIFQEVVDEYGYINLSAGVRDKIDYEANRIEDRSNELIIFNLKVFRVDVMREMKHNSIKTFVLLAYENKVYEKNTWTQKDLINHKYLGLSKPTLIRCLDELVNYGFITKNTVYKGKKESYTYSITPEYIKPFLKNVELSLAASQRIIRELSGNEVKAYLLLKSLYVMNDGDISMYNIKKLGEMIGLNGSKGNNGFTHIIKSLEEKEFIRVIRTGIKEANMYELLM